MPLLPEVASINSVLGPISPEASIRSIMAKALRSLTEEAGLKLSILAMTSAPKLAWRANRLRRTTGVLPTVLKMLSWILGRGFSRGASGLAVLSKRDGALLKFMGNLWIAGIC
jgi:hypothetical protein